MNLSEFLIKPWCLLFHCSTVNVAIFVIVSHVRWSILQIQQQINPLNCAMGYTEHQAVYVSHISEWIMQNNMNIRNQNFCTKSPCLLIPAAIDLRPAILPRSINRVSELSWSFLWFLSVIRSVINNAKESEHRTSDCYTKSQAWTRWRDRESMKICIN
jgi:hypothetical protein